MKILRARLYEKEKLAQEEKLQELHDNLEDIAWATRSVPTCCSPIGL